MLERGEGFGGGRGHVFARGGASGRRATLRTCFAQERWRGSSDRSGSTAGACGETEWACGALPRLPLWRPARTIWRTAIRAADGCLWPQGHRTAKHERRAAMHVGARVCRQPASSHPWHAAALSSDDFTRGRAADFTGRGVDAAVRVASSWACPSLTRASMPPPPRCATPLGRAAASTSRPARRLMPASRAGAASPLSPPPPLPKTMRRRSERNRATSPAKAAHQVASPDRARSRAASAGQPWSS
jgi:hypothetical protein